MRTVQWRPELNALTNPRSYRARPVPKETYGYAELSKRVSQKNPVWSAELVESILRATREETKEILIEGSQVSLEDGVTFHLTINTRLDAPDDQLPQDKNIVNVQAYASRPFVEEVRQGVHLERLPPQQKVPVLAGASDTVLQLDDVLNSGGALRLTGNDLLFHPDKADEGCVIEGTREGRTVQTRFAVNSNTEVIVLPEIPSQTQPWNNEYMVSISTRYTEHGSLRTGTYQRPLRVPIAVWLGVDSGLLSGSGTTPLVVIAGGQLNAEGARVRIQAVLDAQDGDLRINLLDMTENGSAGNEVRVSGNGTYSLPGYPGSDLARLDITVQDYAALENMVRLVYTGRLVDILDVGGGS